MRIAVSGGGTAGHVSPVLAVVAALRKRDPNLQVIFIGQAGGPEAELVRNAGLRFTGILGSKFRRLPGAGLVRNLVRVGDLLLNLRDFFLGIIGTVQALWILARFRPDVVFNKGGTTGLSVGLAARWLHIPMVIHEPDMTPGWGNRTLSRWATAIAVGFPAEQYHDFPRAKLTYTGNPVQPAMLAGKGAAAAAYFGLNPKRPLVLIVGGSQGAAAINAAVTEILSDLLPATQVLHVTGANGYEAIRQATTAAGQTSAQGYYAAPFLPLNEMADAYQAATIVVARAGANTLAELAALRKAVIVLPNHQAAAHQVKNARWLAERGAAVVLPEEKPAPLLAAIRGLLNSPERRRALERAIATCGTPDADVRLADLVVQAAGSGPGSHAR